MMDWMEIGPVPAEESCQQVGTRDYDPIMARKECEAFRKQLIRVHGEPPEGASLRIKSNVHHDAGTYYEVAVKFDSENEKASEYAYKLEAKSPAEWDRVALLDLALADSKYLDRLTDDEKTLWQLSQTADKMPKGFVG